MVNQVGQLKTFYVLGTPPAYPKPIYVWKFQWDGSVMATGTDSGSVVKRLNIGGNPSEGGSPPFVVPFRCDISTSYGHLAAITKRPRTFACNTDARSKGTCRHDRNLAAPPGG